MNGGSGMDVIWMFASAALSIWQRHYDKTGERLTDAQVKAKLLAEIDSGQHAIALWYADKGLPLPH